MNHQYALDLDLQPGSEAYSLKDHNAYGPFLANAQDCGRTVKGSRWDATWEVGCNLGGKWAIMMSHRQRGIELYCIPPKYPALLQGSKGRPTAEHRCRYLHVRGEGQDGPLSAGHH